MAQGNYFSEFSNAVNNGMDYALKSRQIDLHEQELLSQKNNLQATREQQKMAYMEKLSDLAIKMQKINPQVGKALAKTYKAKFAELGVNFGDVFDSMLSTPEGAGAVATYAQGVLDLYSTGNAEKASQAADELFQAIPSEKAVDVITKGGQEIFKIHQESIKSAEAMAKEKRGQEFQEKMQGQRLAQQKEIAAKRLKQSQEHFTSNVVKSLRGEVTAINNRYRPKEQAFKNLFATYTKDPASINPINALSAIKFAQAIIEEKPSVVHVGETEQILRLAPLLSQIEAKTLGWVQGQRIPREVADNIVKSAKVLHPIFQRVLLDEYSRIDDAIKNENLSDRRREILGQDRLELLNIADGSVSKKSGKINADAFKKAIQTFRNANGRGPNAKELEFIRQDLGGQ